MQVGNNEDDRLIQELSNISGHNYVMAVCRFRLFGATRNHSSSVRSTVFKVMAAEQQAAQQRCAEREEDIVQSLRSPLGQTGRSTFHVSLANNTVMLPHLHELPYRHAIPPVAPQQRPLLLDDVEEAEAIAQRERN